MSAPTTHDSPAREAGRPRRRGTVALAVCLLVVLGVIGAGVAAVVRHGGPGALPGLGGGVHVEGSTDEYPSVAAAPPVAAVPSVTAAPPVAAVPSVSVAPVGPPTIPAAHPDRRGFLYAIGRSLTADEVEAVPRSYGVVVMNQWDGAAARRIKEIDPTVTVLMYMCLASMRTTDDATHRSGGVYPSQVAAHPQWYATDTRGQRIPWDPWYGHWQLAVWDTSYQQAWVANALADTARGGWDGVLADNDMSTLAWYSDRLLAGAGSRSATDRKLHAGISALIDRAGPALNAASKLLVVNISDGRLFPGKWAAHSRFGGGMEENFAHFGTSTSGDWVGTAGSEGWLAQTDETRSPGLSLVVTRAAAGDRRTLLYGYASALVRADGDAYWMASVEPDGGYRTLPSIPEMTLPLGRAIGDPVRTKDGAWTRRYEHVWVAVNPTDAPVTLTPASGAAVRLAGHTALMLPTA